LQGFEQLAALLDKMQGAKTPMTTARANLFVYGTLRRESENAFARTLAGEATFVGRGRTQGRLYAIESYPGMISSSNPGEWVTGEVYRLHSPERTLATLDEYEGCGPHDAPPYEFERVLAEVMLDGGGRVRCWTYLYRRPPLEQHSIHSGDYFASR